MKIYNLKGGPVFWGLDSRKDVITFCLSATPDLY